MKSTSLKKTLFALLLAIFVYIWWGNLQLFLSSDSEEMTVYDDAPLVALSTQTPTPSSPAIEFKSYRVNPFVPTFGQPQQETAKKSTPPAPKMVKLSATYQLQGVIQQGKASQAILKAGDGRSIVLGLGDSLETWHLNQVLKQSVIFKQGNHVDTLILANQN